MNLKLLLANELKRLYPDIKPYLCDRYSDKYYNVVMNEIRNALLRPSNDNDELSFNKEMVYRKCGVVSTGAPLLSFMGKSASTRLIDVVFEGNQGKMSRVVLNEKYKEQIMNDLIDLIDEPQNKLTAKELDELYQKANKVIPLDLISLRCYIEQTKLDIENSTGDYKIKISNNKIQADQILMEAREVDGEHYAMEYWTTADTGRVYGHYNSLQRMPKNVRHAALGVCHKYDFQAHSFAVMASLAKMFDPNLKIAAVEDYIRNRTRIRARIARAVGVSEDRIKEVFTSLGFGAKPISNPYTAIHRAVYGQNNFAKLIAQQDFVFITEDLKKINQVILKNYPNEDFVGMNGYKYTCMSDKGRKKGPNKLLAWIYQNLEAHITNEFIKIVRERSGLEPLLTVHDCVYYKDPVPAATITDAMFLLREGFQFVKVEHEKIFPITTSEDYNQRFAEQEADELAHRERIKREEQLARGYKSILSNNTVIKYNPDPIKEIIRQLEWARKPDIPDEYEYEYEYTVNEYLGGNRD